MTKAKSDIEEKLSKTLCFTMPRILTQLNRDPNSCCSGCADRNYSHYKIRDFSSIIIQQAGYMLACAAEMTEFSEERYAFKKIAVESAKFWEKKALSFRAFEEYYAWENGYPPLAFSTLAVARLVNENIIELAGVKKGLRVAVKQLLTRFEPKASNQQVAGTAALAIIRKIAPEMVPEKEFENIVERTLKCQHPEGWYMEYGGPDLGYLAVTMDCLFDAYDATADIRFVKSAQNALTFIEKFTCLSKRGAGMHNARNTDYIVPYGISRCLDFEESSKSASKVLRAILADLDSPRHFIYAVDDRYWCHYIGHSMVRALLHIRKRQWTEPIVDETTSKDEHLLGSGHILRYGTESLKALVSTKKGGIFSLFDSSERSFSDFGWVVKCGKKLYVNHWWSDQWQTQYSENEVIVSGWLSAHKEMISSPFKHIVLRGLSFLFGYHIIEILKEKMIFKKKSSQDYRFERVISFEPDKVVVRDEFQVPDGVLMRAPRSSQRHVASADSFHFEDLNLAESGVLIERDEEIKRSDNLINITTIYRIKK